MSTRFNLTHTCTAPAPAPATHQLRHIRSDQARGTRLAANNEPNVSQGRLVDVVARVRSARRVRARSKDGGIGTFIAALNCSAVSTAIAPSSWIDPIFQVRDGTYGEATTPW